MQVTASTFTGRWGPAAAAFAAWLLDREALHIVASDAHNLKDRPPVMSSARSFLESRIGPEKTAALVESNPRAVVEDRPLNG